MDCPRPYVLADGGNKIRERVMGHRIRLLFIAGLAGLFLMPAAASAGNYNHGYSPGYSNFFGYGGHNNRGHGYGHGNNHYRGNSYYNQGYNNYNRNNYRPSCHSVRKYSYDNYGNRVVIGGTQCYDHYGNPYIVPGSRHIIGYH